MAIMLESMTSSFQHHAFRILGTIGFVGLTLATTMAMAKESGTNFKSLDLSKFLLAYNKAHMKINETKNTNTTVYVKTAPIKFSYAASILIPEEFKKYTRCTVRADLDLKEGGVLLGVLNNNIQGWLGNSSEINASKGWFSSQERKIELSVNQFNSSALIMLQAGAKNSSSEVVIKSIEIGNCS